MDFTIVFLLLMLVFMAISIGRLQKQLSLLRAERDHWLTAQHRPPTALSVPSPEEQSKLLENQLDRVLELDQQERQLIRQVEALKVEVEQLSQVRSALLSEGDELT